MSDSFAIDATSDSSSEQYITLHPVSQVSNDSSAGTREDQATLSSTAKAKFWKQEGMTVAEIADQLGLSVSMIQQELDLVAAASPQTNVASA
jgi:uncharacterized protein YegJ (DUF2314 family)